MPNTHPPRSAPAAQRYKLYAPIEPYAQGHLAVTDGHEIYFEQCGNSHGKPALLIHGGPGAGSNAVMRRFHDPSRYRIILFDQRGCGRSMPHASLDNNTTWDLVADIERLREHLGIDRWQLLGGSWGSTLSLAYAQTHPDRVSELILRGIFLLREAEISWFYQDGCNWIYPDAFERYQSVIPPAERFDMVAAYYRRLTHPNRQIQLEAARAWSMWEGTTLSLHPRAERVRQFGSDAYAVALARIECHFLVNRGFLARDGQLLEDVHRLFDIPGVIVHGRYDVVTPLKNAWRLKKAWPCADLRIVPGAGHAMTEPGIIHELISATRQFAP